MNRFLTLSAVGVLLIGCAKVHAGTITAEGSVIALTDVSQLLGVVGTATFDDSNSLNGMTFHGGDFSSILSGVATSGFAYQPIPVSRPDYFPSPIAGGGVQSGLVAVLAGVVTFSVPVTQFGLTASTNDTQFLTVWDTSGHMLGQVTWQPNQDSAFVGIDTLGVPIGMLSYGNDNLFHGQSYEVGGSTNISDTWIWASGQQAADTPEPATVMLFGISFMGMAAYGWRRKRLVDRRAR